MSTSYCISVVRNSWFHECVVCHLANNFLLALSACKRTAARRATSCTSARRRVTFCTRACGHAPVNLLHVGFVDADRSRLLRCRRYAAARVAEVWARETGSLLEFCKVAQVMRATKEYAGRTSQSLLGTAIAAAFKRVVPSVRCLPQRCERCAFHLENEGREGWRMVPMTAWRR